MCIYISVNKQVAKHDNVLALEGPYIVILP